MHSFRHFLSCTISALLFSAALHAADNGSVTTPDTLLLRSFRGRSIGPATMGGRVSAIALDPADIYTMYVGPAAS
jgi:hypothetical protein